MKKNSMLAVLVCLLMLFCMSIPISAAEPQQKDLRGSEAITKGLVSGVVKSVLNSSTNAVLLAASGGDPDSFAGKLLSTMDYSYALDDISNKLDAMNEVLNDTAKNTEVLIEGQTVMMTELAAIVYQLSDIEYQLQSRFNSLDDQMRQLSGQVSRVEFDSYMNEIEMIDGNTKAIWTQYLYLTYRSYLLSEGASDTITYTDAQGKTVTISLDARFAKLLGTEWNTQKNLWNRNLSKIGELFPNLDLNALTDKEKEMVIWQYTANVWDKTMRATFIPGNTDFKGTDEQLASMLVKLNNKLNRTKTPSLTDLQREIFVVNHPFDHQSKTALLDGMQYGTNIEARLFVMYMEYVHLFDGDRDNNVAFSTGVSACTNAVENIIDQTKKSDISDMLSAENLDDEGNDFIKVRTLSSSKTESRTYLISKSYASSRYLTNYMATDGYINDSGNVDTKASSVFYYGMNEGEMVHNNHQYILADGFGNTPLSLSNLWGTTPNTSDKSLLNYLEGQLNYKMAWDAETYTKKGEVFYRKHGPLTYIATSEQKRNPLNYQDVVVAPIRINDNTISYPINLLDLYGNVKTLDTYTLYKNYDKDSDPCVTKIYVDVLAESREALKKANCYDAEKNVMTPTSFSQFSKEFTIGNNTTLDLSQLTGSGNVTINVSSDATITTGGKMVEGINIVVYNNAILTLEDCEITGGTYNTINGNGEFYTINLVGDNVVATDKKYDTIKQAGKAHDIPRSVIGSDIAFNSNYSLYYSGTSPYYVVPSNNASSKQELFPTKSSIGIVGEGKLTIDGKNQAKYGIVAVGKETNEKDGVVFQNNNITVNNVSGEKQRVSFPHETASTKDVRGKKVNVTIVNSTGKGDTQTVAARAGEFIKLYSSYGYQGHAIVWTVNDERYANNVIDEKEDTAYLLVPDKDVTVQVVSNVRSTSPFVDVNEKDWFNQDILRVYNKNLMVGVSSDKFEPNQNLTRGMAVAILHRMDGNKQVNTDFDFTDVPKNSWFAKDIAWAYKNDLAYGLSSTIFAPEKKVTREQLVAFFYRFAEYKGYDVSKYNNLSKFEDANKISSWVKDELSWAVNIGLIQGRSETLIEPQGNATRAETAAIISRFMTYYTANNK